MNWKWFGVFFIGIVLSNQCLVAQDDPFQIKKYPFIALDKNEFKMFQCQEQYKVLFEKLTAIGLTGQGKVSIVHIGDSHVQADFFSGNVRAKLQTFFVGAQNGRGFVFPYKVAKTNNPLSYRVVSKGVWDNCRNIQANLQCKLGLSGIAVITHDEHAEISVNIADDELPGYDFDRLMVFHAFDETQFKPVIAGAKKVTPYPDKGYTLFEFDANRKKITLQLVKENDNQQVFNLYGLNFESSDEGIVYHTIGINGAQFESYLKCEYFIPHLSALSPDWVIVSLGTNDVYTNVFDADKFQQNVEELVSWIKKAAPNACVLFTLPGDHLMKRQYKNENITKACQVLTNVAAEQALSIWDFYKVMGGEGSIEYWRFTGLAHTDFLHYSQQGYIYQGQLFFNAFIKAYDRYLSNEFQ